MKLNLLWMKIILDCSVLVFNDLITQVTVNLNENIVWHFKVNHGIVIKVGSYYVALAVSTDH